MATDHGPSIKNDEQYKALRNDGMSKEKAARIANSTGAAERGGQSPPYEEWTKDEFDERAQELGVDGRSDMAKDELISALRADRARVDARVRRGRGLRQHRSPTDRLGDRRHRHPRRLQGKLDPRRTASELTSDELDNLWIGLRRTRARVVERNGSHQGVLIQSGARERGEHCPRCDVEITRVKVGGRTTYFCPAHQR